MTLVIGGGIGGLSAAYYLVKNSKKVLIAEAGRSVGGWIQTVKDQKTGLIFEKGPRTIRIKGNIGANTLSLIEEIGLGPQVRPITADQPAAKNRLIYVNENLHYLPSQISSIFKKVSPFSKPLVFGLVKDLIAKKKACEDESIYHFVERRIGHEVAEYLISPMICGICAGNAKEISVKFLMPFLFEYEQKHGSILKGFYRDLRKPKTPPQVFPGEMNERAKKEKWTIFGLENGLSSFPEALSQKIEENGGQIMLNSEINKIVLNKNSVKYQIGDKTDECSHVISSLSAQKLAPLLQEQHPWLSEQLSSIKHVTVGVINIAYKGQVLKHDAFGFLVPPSQNLPILGVIFDSCNFSQGDWTILTVMMGGHWYDKYFADNPSPERFLETALKYNEKILGIKQKPDVYHFQLMKDCIPQYTVGHHKKVDQIMSYVKDNELPISLIGSAFKGIGVNDVILSAKAAVNDLKS